MLNPSHTECGILYVDDEEKALKYFRMALADRFPIFTASSGDEGLELLRREPGIGIVVSDQRMPGMLGAEFLASVRRGHPEIVRILTTAYSDLDSAIQAVNLGHIYQYVVKPWDFDELGMVLARAVDYWRILRERNELMALKMTTLQRILCSDRVKWLLLQARDLPSVRRAVCAMAKALPAEIDIVPAATADARFFEIGSLVRSEYENAERCLSGARAFQDSAGLLSFAQAWRDLSACANVEMPGAGETLHFGAVADADFVRHLFGLLVERKTPELSLRLLDALVAAANEGLGFSLAAEVAGAPVRFDFAPAEMPDAAAEVIDALTEKFSASDIARM